ncbi:aminotransferase class IV [Desulfosporosinus sp. BICA1-9]|uniref:aminotransferase class IV n=1 Tax=Desulfosporosinus sp. BICA1-9 TaxID=1531958 RepID=UPI000AAD9D84|nr:aminotransferase class IV [Desulfosporosinus sp. BICA1-9]HBW36741.1 aminotransferase class IV [Desulfosporosinus sp.]
MIPCEMLLLQDRLALFGYGLFETLLVTEHGPLFTDLHWQRMNKGAVMLGLTLPQKAIWTAQIRDYIDQSPSIAPYALRVTLSGGAPQANLPSRLLFHPRIIPYSSAQYAMGIRLHLLSTPRNEQSPLTSIKSTNYLENILAKEVAFSQGAEEGLWLNTKGFVSEGTMSNLFFIKDGTLFTPSLASGCLPGTRRQLILDLADSLQISIEEGLYSFSDLLQANEIFMTNALMGLMPVRQIDDISFSIESSESPSSKMRQLELAYQDLIHNPSGL